MSEDLPPAKSLTATVPELNALSGWALTNTTVEPDPAFAPSTSSGPSLPYSTHSNACLTSLCSPWEEGY
ncbi:hypothetical protein Tco_0157387 [Tanacetum coccineum]